MPVSELRPLRSRRGRSNTVRRRLSGLAALAVLIAVVVGLPVVLYRFGGSPLPSHLSGWRSIAAALTSPDNGSLLLGTIRDLSWLGWLLFTLAVLAEMQAALRGRAAPRLLTGGLPGGVARLVALAALCFGAASMVTAAASAAVVAPAHAGAVDSAEDPAALRDLAASRLVTVRPGDCLWTIAERYLGAGDLYPEIARLNYGRPMGDGLAFTNPSLIEPGWRLLLPATASTAGALPATAGGGGQHLGHATHNPHYRRKHAAASQRVVVGAVGHVEHSLVSEPPGFGAGRGGPGADVASSGSSGKTEPASAADYQVPTPIRDVAEPALFAAGALAGAVLTNLTRLRRRQRQHRRPGRRIGLPADGDVLGAEHRLRAGARVGPPSTLRDALDQLTVGFAGNEQTVLPDIVGLHVTPRVLEVLLAAPAQNAPPPPFAISPGRQGMCWQLAMPLETGQGKVTAASADLLSGLFTAGRTDDGYLLLDLESLQLTACDGPPELVDAVIAAIGLELTTRQWSGCYDLVLVGFAELEVLGRAEHCASLEEALPILDARSQATRRRLADRSPADVRQLRLSEPDDEDWGLTVLVSRLEPSADQLGRLLDLAEDGPGGIAALVAGDPEAADGRMAPTALQLAPDPRQADAIVANVVPLQIAVRPEPPTAAEYQAISTLFATAADTADLGPEQPPYEMYAAPPWLAQAETPGHGSGQDGPTATLTDARPPPPSASATEPGSRPPLEVRVLGSLVITGVVAQLQPKQAELVVALALAAPGGLSNSALCSMLGTDPDHPKPAEAVRQVIARTRRRLGLAGDGREYIIHTGNGMYLLHPDASLDWTQFRRLIASSHVEDMRTALAMVRGEPFTGSYYWWIDIPLLETVRAEIIDAAQVLAEYELVTDSPRAAARAARAGLAADVSAEQLWRLVMRAEHAAGNVAGVAEAWRHCLDAIADIAPDGEPHPDTETLFRQLTGTPWQHAPARS